MVTVTALWWFEGTEGSVDDILPTYLHPGYGADKTTHRQSMGMER